MLIGMAFLVALQLAEGHGQRLAALIRISNRSAIDGVRWRVEDVSKGGHSLHHRRLEIDQRTKGYKIGIFKIGKVQCDSCAAHFCFVVFVF